MSQLCRAIGCRLSSDVTACERCGERLYEGFRQFGYLDPVQRLLRRVAGIPRRARRWIVSPCEGDGCKKRVWFSFEPCCSRECADRWVPF